MLILGIVYLVYNFIICSDWNCFRLLKSLNTTEEPPNSNKGSPNLENYSKITSADHPQFYFTIIFQGYLSLGPDKLVHLFLTIKIYPRTLIWFLLLLDLLENFKQINIANYIIPIKMEDFFNAEISIYSCAGFYIYLFEDFLQNI